MTRRTRLFVAISAGILVVGLGTGLLASYMGIQNLTLIGGNGPAEFAYVPSDAQVLGYANVRAVMDSEVRRKLMDVHPDADGAAKFQERTGINLMEDVDSVLAAITPEMTDGQGPPLVLARGRFDQVRLEGFAREEGGVVEDFNGTRLITHDEFAVAFVEPGLVALGRPAVVRRAIETRLAGGGSISGNDDVMRLVKQVEDGTVWGVARFDALTGMRIPNEVKDRLPAISWFSVKGMVNGGVDGLISAEARDDQAAQDLRQVVQGLVALGRMQAGPGNPEIADFVNSLQITGQGRTVSLGFSLPASMIDTLGAMRAGRRPPQAQPEAAPETPERPEPRRPAPPAL
ncbi:MAG TPA: hypothetical protein VFM12_03000 [Gemmatimonadales bacterium]|nr:hypothetical protein [Gemmatimonadales bacterium]